MNKSRRIYQFRIQLKEIKPAIWRRIQVPESYTMWDLHVAIQDSMGWLDYHLHMFKAALDDESGIREIGIPDADRFVGDPEILPGWDIPITECFQELGETIEYEYDFGDGWQHEIMLEGVLIKEKRVKYPKCIDGKRACPPEDCGGVPGYYNVVEVLGDKNHEEHQSMRTWVGEEYSLNKFDCRKVKFDNPDKRWEIAFRGQ